MVNKIFRIQIIESNQIEVLFNSNFWIGSNFFLQNSYFWFGFFKIQKNQIIIYVYNILFKYF